MNQSILEVHINGQLIVRSEANSTEEIRDVLWANRGAIMRAFRDGYDKRDPELTDAVAEQVRVVLMPVRRL